MTIVSCCLYTFLLMYCCFLCYYKLYHAAGKLAVQTIVNIKCPQAAPGKVQQEALACFELFSI